ncbi:MAG: hypothetical protein BroJett018_54490 [Chloroflexota bacterium]|nr:hypothetical protein [Chloroflexota bacterium]GIK67655.1 MAG: hypothetical protein BroJett018_54490 [Chloroflexota bacterium]
MGRKFTRHSLYIIGFSVTVSLMFFNIETAKVFPYEYPTPTPRPEYLNPGETDSLAVIDGGNGWTSLISTLEDYPPDWHVESYALDCSDGQWVMGDWDGDGRESLGGYGYSTFFFTNLQKTVGQCRDWSRLWIGPQGQPVAGHFRADLAHDCIGIVEQLQKDGHTTFVLWYTCDLATTAPEIHFQILGELLPKLAGYSGFPQFVAGDWDGDGVETLAVRRGGFVTYTNTPPTDPNPVFTDAQAIGLPYDDEYEYGVFVAGDWDDDGIDSFGFYYFFLTYQLGADRVNRYFTHHEFYYCTQLICLADGYQFVRMNLPLGSPWAKRPINAVSWRYKP